MEQKINIKEKLEKEKNKKRNNVNVLVSTVNLTQSRITWEKLSNCLYQVSL